MAGSRRRGIRTGARRAEGMDSLDRRSARSRDRRRHRCPRRLEGIDEAASAERRPPADHWGTAATSPTRRGTARVVHRRQVSPRWTVHSPASTRRSSPHVALRSRYSDSTRRIPVTEQSDTEAAGGEASGQAPKTDPAHTYPHSWVVDVLASDGGAVALRPNRSRRRGQARRIPWQTLRAHPVSALLRPVPHDVGARRQELHDGRPPQPRGVS